MFEISLIICALMRGHVVAVRQRKNGVEYRFTLCHFGSDGTICQLNDCGQICYYRNIHHVYYVLQYKSKRYNASYDAAIMPDPVAEGLFLAGQEAPAVRIDPPHRVRIAA